MTRQFKKGDGVVDSSGTYIGMVDYVGDRNIRLVRWVNPTEIWTLDQYEWEEDK